MTSPPQNLSSRPERTASSSAQWRDLQFPPQRHKSQPKSPNPVPPNRVPHPLQFHRKGWGPTTTASLNPYLLLAALLLLIPTAAHAQGCAQCLDSTRATPPAVQAAYRHAILLLAGFAATLFLAGLLLLGRNR